MAFASSQRIVEALPYVDIAVGVGTDTGTFGNTGIDLYDAAIHRYLFTLIGPTGGGSATMELQWAIGSYDVSDGTVTLDASNYAGLSAVEGTVSTLIEAVVERTDSAAGTADPFVQQLEVGSTYLVRAPSTSASRRAYLRAKVTHNKTADGKMYLLIQKLPRYSEPVADQPSFVQTPVAAHDL